MKTSLFNLDLMQPGSANKDLVYNENLLKIDCLMNGSVVDFVTETPPNLAAGMKFIITEGEHKGKICYKTHPQKPPAFLSASAGQVLFVQAARAFFAYDGVQWLIIQSPAESTRGEGNASDSASSDPSSAPKGSASEFGAVAVGSNTLLTGEEKFLGIEGEYEAPADHEFLHLYINNDVTINLDMVKTRMITCIIKQHYQSVKQLTWPHNILWPNKTPHKLTAKANATDIIRLYRLVETNHFLGDIVAQNYQF